MSQAIPLTQIREDAELQPRVKMDPVAVNEYAEAMKRGDHFPAVVVFDVPKEGLLLVDGYHRLHAARSASKETLDAEIIPGERREAILYSLKVNDTHGIRRTNSDKRRAVERLLSDPEWMNWNNQKIAEACRVTGEFVRKLRSHPSCNNCKIPTERTVERNGKTYTMDTSNIGKRTVQDVPGPIQVISDEPRTTPISVQEANNLMFDAAPKQPTEPAEKPGQPVLPSRVRGTTAFSFEEKERRAKAFVETLNDEDRSVLGKIIAKKGLLGYHNALNIAIQCARREAGLR